MTPPMVDDGFEAVTAFDVSDDSVSMLANHIRALRRDMQNGFESIAAALKTFTRIDAKLDVIIDRQNVADVRMDAQDRRMDSLDQRFAAIESALPVATVVKKRASRPRKK